MRDQRKAEDIAQQRMELISPLLADGLDPAKAESSKLVYVSKPVYQSVLFEGMWHNTGNLDLTV
jgi:hypothetical protein